MCSSLCQVICLWNVAADSNIFETKLPFRITAANIAVSYNENIPHKKVSSSKYSSNTTCC